MVVTSRTSQFFAATFALRAVHALASLPFHVDGDVGIPWLMTNDWEQALNRRFYWGQDYLGTYEQALLSKFGHLIFGAQGVIPLAFVVLAGQLEYALGVTLLFAALRKLRPGFGDRVKELGLAVALLGFMPPVLEKYSFGPGMGFSLVPLATGLAVWLWAAGVPPGLTARNASEPMLGSGNQREESQFSIALPVLTCAGVAFGLMITASRLCLVPTLALLACFTIALELRGLLALAAGITVGLSPELAIGVERSAHHTVAFTPLIERWHNFANALSQTGLATGLLPVALRIPEDTLYARGHAPIAARPVLDALAIAAFVALAWVTRRELRKRPGWIFAAIAAVNFGLIAVDGISVDQPAARRYSAALILAVSAWLLVEWRSHLARAFTLLRVGILAVYLAASVTYASPFGEMRKILEKERFQTDRDCLSGHGGDLTAAMALSGQVARVVSYGWRLPGNYSRAVAASGCARIFHIDTGAVPVGQAQCVNPVPVYVEPGRPAFRSPVAVYRCQPSSAPEGAGSVSPQGIPERTKKSNP